MKNLTPPQALEAEASLLGSLMLDHEAIDSLPYLPVPAFYKEAHRIVYRAILELSESGTPPDLVLLIKHLTAAGDLQRVGGAAFLSGLMEGTPLSAYASHYAEIVLEEYRKRELINVTRATMQGAYDGTQVDKLLSDHEQALTSLARFDNVQRDGNEYVRDALDLISGVGGLSTGFVDVDEATGGLVRGGYNVIAARPSIGKSSYLRSVLQHRVREGDRVALFSVDQSGGEIYALTAAARLRRSLTDFRVDRHGRSRATDGERQAFERELVKLKAEWDNRLVVHDTLSDAARILQVARREIRAGATVIAVDHLQSLSLDGKTDDTAAVSNISRMFKALSREFNVTVVLLSQLGRSVEHNPNKIPALKDLRQSGAIEEDANQVVFLYRPEYYSDLRDSYGGAVRPGEMDVIVAKNKLGSVPHTVTLTWLGEYAVAGNRARV